MKKILVLIVALLCLAGCASKNKEKSYRIEDLKIVSPTGAPAVAFYNYADNDNFETNTVPSDIVAMMVSDDAPDVVVIDTTSGIKAIGKGADYKLAATITFGNFYIASTGNDEDDEMGNDDSIVLFGMGQTPDLVWHFLFGDYYDNALIYETNVQGAQADLINGSDLEGREVDYVFIAQPALFAAMKKNENVKAITDIQQMYEEKSGSSMIQASVFVNNSVPEEEKREFLDSLRNDIEAALKNPEVIAEGMGKIGEEEAVSRYGINPNIAMAVVKGGNVLGLGFKNAYDNKEAIDKFIGIFGIEETSEEIYFR